MTKTNHHSSRICWAGCFLFLSLLIGMVYQSELSSTITAILPPLVPKTTTELSSSGLPVITVGDFRDSPKVYISLLLVMVDRYLISALQNKTYASQFQAIRIKTNWIDLGPSELGNRISLGLPFKNSDGDTLRFESDSTFVFADGNPQMATFVATMQYHGNFMLIGNRELFPFEILKPWVLRKNFLQPILSNSFKKLVYSGILQKWEQLFHIFMLKKETVFKNQTSYAIAKQMANAKLSNANLNISSVNLEAMKYFFYVFMLLLATCLIVYIVEVLLRLDYSKLKIAKNQRTFETAGQHLLIFLRRPIVISCIRINRESIEGSA